MNKNVTLLTLVACRGCGRTMARSGNGATEEFGMNYCYPPEYTCECGGKVLAWFHVPQTYLLVDEGDE